MNSNQEVSNDSELVQVNMEDLIKKIVYELYDKYKNTKDKEYLIRLISILNDNISLPNIGEFLNLEIENNTLFDIMLKLRIDFTDQTMKYICSHDELFIKVLKNRDYRILSHASEEDFFRKINGITIFEYLLKNDIFDELLISKFENRKEIIQILKKYNKENYLRKASENILFEKFDDDKLVIEYLLEQDLFHPQDIDIIKNHPEIIDYIEKYDKKYLLPYLKKEIVLAKKDDKLVLEHLLEKGIAPILTTVTDDEIVNLLIKYKAYTTLSEITIKHAFIDVPDSNMQLFEFLLYRGIVSYNVISEIYRNTKYAPVIYEILKKHHNLNLLSNYDEDRMLLKYGQQHSLLESLLKDNQIIQVQKYENKESLDLLLKYDRYDEISKCSESLLLYYLPNGKRVYEELIDRGIVIQTEKIIYQQIAKKIIDEKHVEQFGCLSVNVLLSYSDLDETYLDKALEVIKEANDFDLINNLHIEDESVFERARIYLIFAKHDVYKYIEELKVEMLLEEEDGTTLLDELLKEDKEATLKLLLTEKIKSNVDVASILKLYGVKQKNINYDIVTKNIADEYTKKDIDELKEMPLNPSQERLLQQLFITFNDGKSESNRLNALIATYRYLLSTNNQYANEIYHLIELKKQNPEFCIEETKEISHYSDTNHAIRLENLNVGTINHEVSHALHFMIDKASVPNGFKELIDKHKKSIRTRAMVSLFSKRYRDTLIKVSKYVDRVIMPEYDRSITQEDITKIREYLDTINSKSRKVYEERGYTKQLLDMIFDRRFTVGDYLKQTRKIQRREIIDRIMRTEYPHFIVIGDFFDGIYEGKFRDGKLTDVFGLTYLKSSYGHGIEYYKDDIHAVFKEMIANYGQIMKSKKHEEGLKLLRTYLGDELVAMVSNHYLQNIYHNYSYIDTEEKKL